MGVKNPSAQEEATTVSRNSQVSVARFVSNSSMESCSHRTSSHLSHTNFWKRHFNAEVTPVLSFDQFADVVIATQVERPAPLQRIYSGKRHQWATRFGVGEGSNRRSRI